MKLFNSRFAYSLLGVFLLAALAYAFVLSQRERHEEEFSLRRRRAAWSRQYSPVGTREAVGDGEVRELTDLYSNIAHAYTNGQLDAMMEFMGSVSNRVQDIGGDAFYAIEHLIYAPFINGFCDLRSLETFQKAQDFERYAAINVEMAKFIGRMCFRRRDYWDAHLLIVESQTFAKLQKYVERFGDEGRLELVDMANRYLERWIEFIESDEGISRALAHYQYEQHMALNDREGRLVVTPEKALGLARSLAVPLCKKGYTPKWLDKDFPVFGVQEKKWRENQ